MTKKFTVEIAVGDKIQQGRLALAELTVKDIEYDKFGHPVLVLNNGRKRTVFNLRLSKLIPEGVVASKKIEVIE
jgi:hypothetical protein|tara:strand:+ start:64 stop:285 length:222 start_codon:yes stop_codon:yes gene_type:complete